MKLLSTFLRNETQRYALAGALFGLAFPVIATLVRIAMQGQRIDVSSAIAVQASDPLLWIIDTAPVFLGLFAAFAGFRQDRLLSLNSELRQQSTELEKSRYTMEQRVKERTAAIERRANQLQLIAETARTIAIAEIQDLSELLPRIVNLVSSQFEFYHTGIFLFDGSRENAILQAANSAGGRNLLSRQYRVPIDSNTIVGYTALLGEPRLVNDLEIDSGFYKNPELPDSRSEIGIPLRIRERVIGVLDVQSNEKDAFSPESIDVLTILSDQIAVAIDNAQLFDEAKSSLAEARATLDQYVKQEWTGFSKQTRQNGFIYDGRQVLPLTMQVRSERAKNAAKTGRLTLDQISSYVTVPIRLRGQTIGVLEVRPKKGQRQWSDDEIALLEAAADRAALALENARLVENAQRRAARERAIGEIAGKVGSVSERNLILQTAVEELGRKMNNTEVILELESQPST